MAVFVLLHGGWGTPGEWSRVVDGLAALGHVGIAVDLPIGDPAAGLREHAEVVARAAAEVDAPVVVVAHSGAGAVAALLPALRPVRHLVYEAAIVPVPGEPMLRVPPGAGWAEGTGDFLRLSPRFRALMRDAGDGLVAPDLEQLALLSAGPIRAAAVMPLLRSSIRPQALGPFLEPWPGAALPDVPTTYLLAAADPVFPPEEQRVMAARAGVAPVLLPGADHAPHWTMPRRIVALLAALPT